MLYKKFRLTTILAAVLSMGIADPMLAENMTTQAKTTAGIMQSGIIETTVIKNVANFPARIRYVYLSRPLESNETRLIAPGGGQVRLSNADLIQPYEAWNDYGSRLCMNTDACTTDDQHLIVFQGINADGTCNFTCA